MGGAFVLTVPMSLTDLPCLFESGFLFAIRFLYCGVEFLKIDGDHYLRSEKDIIPVREAGVGGANPPGDGEVNFSSVFFF